MGQLNRAFISVTGHITEPFILFKPHGKLAALWYDEIITDLPESVSIPAFLRMHAKMGTWSNSTSKELSRFIRPVRKYFPNHKMGQLSKDYYDYINKVPIGHNGHPLPVTRDYIKKRKKEFKNMIDRYAINKQVWNDAFKLADEMVQTTKEWKTREVEKNRTIDEWRQITDERITKTPVRPWLIDALSKEIRELRESTAYSLLESFRLWQDLNHKYECAYISGKYETKFIKRLYQKGNEKEPFKAYKHFLRKKFPDLNALSWDQIIDLRHDTFFENYRTKIKDLHRMFMESEQNDFVKYAEEIFIHDLKKMADYTKPPSTMKSLVKSALTIETYIGKAMELFSFLDDRYMKKKYGWVYFGLYLEEQAKNIS